VYSTLSQELPKSPQAPTRSRTPSPVIIVIKEKADQPDRATVKVPELKGILSALYNLNSNSVICSMPDVVITGASSGIGFAACEALIRRGFRVFGSVRTKADADRLTEQLGRQYVPLIFDVTDPDSVNWDTSQHGTCVAPGVEWPLSRRDTPCFPAN
jgi:hypothetical protein